VRVVFFGTPEFAVPSLEALLGEGFDVVAVVTQPDKPQGRSRSTAVPPPVKTAAEAEDVPVLQPARPSDPDFVERLRGLAPDVGVVVAYGHILKPELLALPRRGMINLHPSLLPELRGAAPVEWAILNGLTQTGVTIMQMDAGLDSGPILLQIPHDIDPEVTGGELSEHLSEMGAQALVEALALSETNGLEPHPQEQARATYAPKLTRHTARIRWADPAERVARLIRALDPRPGAWTELDGREIKLFGARVVEGRGAPGAVQQTDDGCSAPESWKAAVRRERYSRPMTAWRSRRDKERSGSRRSNPRARRAWPPRSGSAAAARRRASASGEGTPGPATAARRHRRADRPPAGPGSSSAATRSRRSRGSRLPRARSRAIRPGALRARRPTVRLSARPPVRE